jgi:hypothetical protein
MSQFSEVKVKALTWLVELWKLHYPGCNAPNGGRVEPMKTKDTGISGTLIASGRNFRRLPRGGHFGISQVCLSV